MRRGLFLDLDGTLADSLGVMKAVFVAFHADRGLPCTDADFAAANGPPLPEILRQVQLRHHLPEEPHVLLAEYWRRLEAEYLRVPASDGAEDLLRTAFDRRWLSAIVTSSSEKLTRAWLGQRDLDRYVAVVVGAESAPVGKPSPAPYQVALERTGADASASIAIEDSGAGLSSATGAGLFTFFLDHGTGSPVSPGAPNGPEQLPGFATIRSLREVLPRIIA